MTIFDAGTQAVLDRFHILYISRERSLLRRNRTTTCNLRNLFSLTQVVSLFQNAVLAGKVAHILNRLNISLLLVLQRRTCPYSVINC